MYLAVDIGGTKTAIATLNVEGIIQQRIRIPTAKKYDDFIRSLADAVGYLTTNKFTAAGVAVPGKLDRKKGIGIAMGNLPWENVPIRKDVERIVRCPVVIENDAKLAGLSEAMLLKNKYDRVAYVTISTGIGVGIIANQQIEPNLIDAEPGKTTIEHNGKMVAWESFASGKAIVKRYGKMARDITDLPTWRQISQDIALGLIHVIAVVQPQVIVMGGSVSAYFDRFGDLLHDALKRYEVPLIPIPPIIPAARPDDAVLYGCYDLAKSLYGKAHS